MAAGSRSRKRLSAVNKSFDPKKASNSLGDFAEFCAETRFALSLSPVKSTEKGNDAYFKLLVLESIANDAKAIVDGIPASEPKSKSGSKAKARSKAKVKFKANSANAKGARK